MDWNGSEYSRVTSQMDPSGPFRIERAGIYGITHKPK